MSDPHSASPSLLMHLALAIVVLAQSAAAAISTTELRGARGPAFAGDGRLAVSVDGDLWLQQAGDGARWVRLTSGASWDREPAWSPDGSSIVFASDRAGTFDLWRLRIGAGGASGAPERLTSTADSDGEPSVAADGRIVFARGRGAASRLWLRGADGAEKRLTKRDVGEYGPALSVDGKRVAYVTASEDASRLRVRTLAGDADSVVLGDRAAEHPVWSPAGDRIVFTVGGARPGVFVTPLDGRYVNLVSTRRAEAAWSPDGRTLALADLPADPPGYNGDPARLADRDVADVLGEGGRLWIVDAPPAPDDNLAERAIVAARPRALRNAEVFDREWERTAKLYFADAGAEQRRTQWEALRVRYRPEAVAAASDDALEEVLWRMQRERPPLRDAATGRAAVSSAHPIATAAGLEILRKGGNVVDAAVAVSFALGVVEPDASGIGGYGQMVVHLRGMERPALIEFMSRVPEEATLSNASLAPNGRYPSDGPVLVNVPGTVAGMHLAWRRFGSTKVAWGDLVAPAIRAARDGFPVSEGLATTLATERQHYAKYESSRALFFRDGEPLHAGDVLRNPDLAWTLEQIAKSGADGFYKGEVARRMVADLRGKGNAMQLTDLSRYFAVERAPVSGTYRGHTLYSSAPPVSGGANLVAQLNLLEQLPAPRPYVEDATTLHAMIAAWQLVPSARGRIADPALWPVTTEPFVSKDTARARWRCFAPSKSLTPAAFRGDSLLCAGTPAKPAASSNDEGRDRSSDAPSEELLATGAAPSCDSHDHAREAGACHASGTTSYAVADADGNAVSVTQTLGTWGGNFYVSPGLGFLYNDKLTSYSTDPSAYGARLPYARHGSTIAPTIVLRGEGAARRPVLAVGAAGNAWITAAVYQTLVGVLDQGLSPQQALELPRFLPSGRGTGAAREFVIDLEDGFSPQTVRALRAMGYNLEFISLPGELRMGYGAAITIGDGEVTAGADPRRSGAAGAIPK